MKKVLAITLCSISLLCGCTDPDAISKEYESGYDEGYDEGFYDGEAKGYSAGEDDGYSIGHEEGYNAGYEEGYNYGHEDGYNIGYDTGYSDCAYDYNLEVSDDAYDNCGTDYESTWGDLIDANGGEPVWGTLTTEQKALVNYPYFDMNKVYYVPDGKNFHSVEWCYTLEKSKTIYSCTYGEALDYGLDSCSKCIYE